MTSTPNKGYTLQGTGTNTGTWGVVLNQIYSIIDNNLGGTLTLSVAGNSNVTLTANQAESLIYNFTGVLTGNINVIFPAAGGLYFINNQTTGPFTLTIQAGASVNGFLVPQGTQAPIAVDNSTSPPTIDGASGTPYVFTLGTIAGTANALTAATAFPSNFALNPGTLITFTPTANNTGSSTLTIGGGSAEPLQKLGATGLINLQGGDLFAGIPNIAYWNGSVWVILNLIYSGTPTQLSTSATLSFAYWLQPTIATAPLVLTVPQTSANFTYYFSFPLTAGAPVVWQPFSTDTIWVNGTALAAGAPYGQPKGSTAKLTTDAISNIYLDVDNANLSSNTSSVYAYKQYGVTAPVGTNTNQLATTKFVLANTTGLLNIQVLTGTSGTYTPTAGTTSFIAHGVADGGGGGGAGGSPTGGSAGSGTTLGTAGAILNLAGGHGGSGNTATIGIGGAGGAVTTATIGFPGSAGGNAASSGASSGTAVGGNGAPGMFGSGAGIGGVNGSVTGGAASGNTGAGGGGAVFVSTIQGGAGGGGAGAQGIAYVTSPAANYPFSCGAGGAGGTGTNAGGSGAPGMIIVYEY